MPTCPSCRKRYPENVTTCSVDGDTLLPNEAFSGVDADLAAGHVVGEYRIDKKIGEGGFGSVYRAVHPLIGKTAAIKVLNRQYSSNPQMVSRFISEARAVNQIRHRNIIDIFSFGALEDGRQYYVMEMLEGMTLSDFMKERGRIPPDVAIPIFRSLARALDAAHAAGIAHRDLKPENIFLSFDEDGGIFPKLLDFGIAKLLATDGGASGQKTRTGTPMGTPYYMSPEQCRGKNVDHRTDIYSFGIMVHEVLTGKLPFDGDDMMDLLIKQTTAPAPPLSSIVPELPAALDAPLLRMLEKDAAMRPESLSAAVEGLARAASGAGLNVVVAAGLSADLRHTPRMTPDLSPSELGRLVEARTMMDASTGGGLTPDSNVPPPPKSRMGLIAAIGAVCMVLGGGGVIFMMTRNKPTVAQAAPAINVVAPTPSMPVVIATPSAAAAAGAPVEVAVTVRSVPEHAAIYIGDERIGVAPGPVKIPRADKVRLVLKAEGFAPTEVEVEAKQDNTVSVKLTKAATSHHAKPPVGQGDKPADAIETPTF